MFAHGIGKDKSPWKCTTHQKKTISMVIPHDAPLSSSKCHPVHLHKFFFIPLWLSTWHGSNDFFNKDVELLFPLFSLLEGFRVVVAAE